MNLTGQPLFLSNIGDHNLDPNKTLVLNPAAWVDAAPGRWDKSRRSL